MTLHFESLKLQDEAGRLSALYRYEILDTDPEREFEEIIALVKSIFGVPIAAISLVAEERQWFKSSVGLEVQETPRSVAFCHYTIQGSDPLQVDDAPEHPLFAQNPLVTGAPGIRCYLGVPLTTPDGYNIGSLCVIGTEPRWFSPADEAVLQNLGRLVVSKLELRMLARRDALTAALSRRAFEVAVMDLVAMRQDGEPCTLLLLDIDHFKFVNDRFGHPTGDEVLRAVVDVLRKEMGPEGRVGRLGGEEFAVVLPGQDARSGQDCAERIRTGIAALSLPHLKGHHVTISTGVAPWQPGMDGFCEWFGRADVALYAAKRGGRNQVRLAA
jgi:diguanylate cyclase (GGDEF)-like protein